jgi:ELWxxDGT repeat protein
MKPYLFLLTFLTPLVVGAQGITLVKDLSPGGTSTEVNEYKEYSGMLYFSTGKSGTGSTPIKAALWRTDGSSAGTILLKSFYGDAIYNLTEYGNKLYFFASDSIHGLELWTTDGTTMGTYMVRDINPNGSSISLNFNLALSSYIKILNNKMFFIANDGTHCMELWVSDGTYSGTTLFIDLNTTPPTSPTNCNTPGAFFESMMEVSNNKLYFYGTTSLHPKIFTTDGINGILDSIYAGFTYGAMIGYNNKVYFAGWYDSLISPALMRSDGTEAGTYPLLPNLNFNIKEDFIWNNKLYMVMADGCCAYPLSLYSIDANDQVELIKGSFSSGSSAFGPFDRKGVYLTAFNNLFYFSHGYLWESDGTAAGTVPITTVTHAIELIVANNTLFFKAEDSSRTEIWKSDGTVAGTQPIKMPNASSPTYYTERTSPIHFFKNAIYYNLTYDTAVGKELYKIELFPAAVSEVEREAIAVYPNPAKEHITVQLKGAVEFVVYDVYGKQLIRCSESDIDISALLPGVYVIEARQNDKSYYQPFLKE